MKKVLLVGLLMSMMIVSAACGNNSASEPATQDEIQESVQEFYNHMSELDERGKTSLSDFNAAVASYSAGTASGDELQKALDKFQDTATDLADQVEKVKLPSNLPENIQTLLRDSMIAFKSAYSIKEQASEGAASPTVTADEFTQMNQQADVAMLYGISKLNEARVAAGLIEKDEAATTDIIPSGNEADGAAAGNSGTSQ